MSDRGLVTVLRHSLPTRIRSYLADLAVLGATLLFTILVGALSLRVLLTSPG